MMDADKFKRISKRIESYRKAMIEMQIALSAVPALGPENGGEGESLKADLLKKRLSKLGFKNFQHYNARDKNVPSGIRPNFVTTITGKNKTRFIWILTHLDIVPPGELKLWSRNPYSAYVKDGLIYGRGVEDNQQDMVASIFAAKSFIDEEITPVNSIGLVFISDEETSSKLGLRYMLNCSNQPFGRNDLIIVPDSGNAKGTLIEVAEKSLLWLRFKTIGKQCHASKPDFGNNAFVAASHLVTKLGALKKAFPKSDPLFDPPASTFEPTKKESNVDNINTIPGEDVFHMDCRLLPDYRLQNVMRTIKKINRGVEDKFKVKIETSTVQYLQTPKPTSPHSSIVHAMQKAIKYVYGIKAYAGGIGGSTVAACFREKKYPVAVWSKINQTAHQPDENCSIENMIGNAKVFAHVFLQE